MYFTDSPSGNIFNNKFDLKTGGTSDREVFFHLRKTNEEWPVPDGPALDVEGNQWVALCSGGKVLKISPEGKVLGEIRLHTWHITCPALVGMNLYISSTVEDEPEEYPESVKFGGSLFKVDVGVEGAPL